MPTPMTHDTIAAIDALLAPFDRDDSPGLVVMAAIDGVPVYRRAVGLASVQHGVANTPSTRMRIGSTSKQFTCLAVLLLAEDGLLDIDGPVADYLPDAPHPRGMPTIAQFMNHTSGYRCTLDMGTLGNGWARQPSDWQVDTLLRQRDVNFAPGQAQMYCNGTYRALSVIVERVSGMPFATFLKKRVLDPLGMHDTEHVASDDTMVPGLAAGHVRSANGGWARGPVDTDSFGEGGLVSTGDDLLRWTAHLRGGKRVGNETTWRRMLAPTVLANGLISPYGFGIKRTSYREVEVLHHSGAVTGFNSQVLMAPAHALDIVVLVNGAAVSASRMAEAILECVLGERELAPSPSYASAGDDHLVGRRYRSDDGLVVTFDDVAGKLGVAIANLSRAAPLVKDGDDVCVTFDALGQGPYRWRHADLCSNGIAPETIAMELGGEPARLQRLDPPETPVRTIDALPFGRYRSIDLRADAELSVDEGLVLSLRGDYSGSRTFDLVPFSDRTFGVVDRGSPDDRYVLDVDRSGAGRPGFWMDTFRARRIRFDIVDDAS